MHVRQKKVYYFFPCCQKYKDREEHNFRCFLPATTVVSLSGIAGFETVNELH